MAATKPETEARRTREQARARIVAAVSELVRERSYAELNVGEIMERAGIGRTLFYRHFDDLGDLLSRATREAIEELYAAEVALESGRAERGHPAIAAALELPVDVYRRHGPLLRARAEAAAADPRIAAEGRVIRERFNQLLAAALAEVAEGLNDPAETARALNLLSEAYLLEAFGHEPRISAETATRTLTEIWAALIEPR